MPTATISFADQLRQRLTLSLTRYRDFIVGKVRGDKTLTPEKAEPLCFAAQKTPDDVEHDMAWCANRLDELQKRQQLLKVAEQSDGTKESEALIADKKAQLKALESALAELDARKRALLAPVAAIDSKMAQLEQRPRQINEAREAIASIDKRLIANAPEWILEELGKLEDECSEIVKQTSNFITPHRNAKLDLQQLLELPQQRRSGDHDDQVERQRERVADAEAQMQSLHDALTEVDARRGALLTLACTAAWPLASDVQTAAVAVKS